jgi:group I intron endonuclease
MIKIYTLTDPLTNQVRYVGKTSKSLDERLAYHFYDLKRGKNKHKINWFNKLIDLGLKPIIEIVDEVDDDDWQFWERYWISQFKTWGFNLINYLEGGEGYTSEDVKKLWLKPEYRLAQTERMIGDKNPFFGKTHSDETKEILRVKCPKKGLDNGNFGKKNSDEQKEKNRLSQPTLVTIVRMDIYGVEIDKWVGLKKMCRELGLDEAAVLRVIKGKNKHHKNFKFKYYEGSGSRV